MLLLCVQGIAQALLGCRYRAISLQFSMCYLSHLLHERIWIWKWLALLKKVLLIFISRRVRGQLDESSEFH